MKAQQPDPGAVQLAALAGNEQAQFAVTLISSRTRRDTLRAALAVLHRAPVEQARPALLALIEHYGANGGVRDYGGYVRADALRALRPLARSDDAALLLRCANTYEFPPPAFSEETALLRSAALVALAEVDDRLARFEAARLLVDPYTDPMSGEPARTAAQTLAALGEILPLYQYVSDPAHAAQPEVSADCLRALTGLPAPLLPALIARCAGAPSAVQVGLIDLLLLHPARAAHAPELTRMASEATPEVARYLVLAIVAAGDETLLDGLAESLRFAPRERIEALRDALELAGARASVAALLERFSRRRR